MSANLAQPLTLPLAVCPTYCTQRHPWPQGGAAYSVFAPAGTHVRRQRAHAWCEQHSGTNPPFCNPPIPKAAGTLHGVHSRLAFSSLLGKRRHVRSKYKTPGHAMDVQRVMLAPAFVSRSTSSHDPPRSCHADPLPASVHSSPWRSPLYTHGRHAVLGLAPCAPVLPATIAPCPYMLAVSRRASLELTSTAPVDAGGGHTHPQPLPEERVSQWRTPAGVMALFANEKSIIAEADAWAKTVQSLESPLTQKIRIKTLSDWAAFLKVTQPQIPEEDYWNRNVVEQNWDRFLYVQVKTSTPRSGKSVIKARTLSGWSGLFLHCIVVYTRDPATKQKCGLSLLIKEGLFQKLKAQVVQLIHDFKLDRHYDTRIFYGRRELQIMQAHILDNSRHTGRQVAIQHLNRMNATFFFSSRASSLGPTHEKWRNLGYVPTCGDLRVFRKGYMEYQIEIRLKFHKMHIGTAAAVDQTFLIEGVKYAHNINFDYSITMLAHLFLRGVFQKKYETVKELVEDPSSELQIDPHFKDAPLFLEVAPGGREFTFPPKAAMSRSHYDHIQYWAGECGLARVGATAFRRDTGNYYGLQMGERVAKDVLNHKAEGIFRNHYSRAMANYNFVQLRLGEVVGTNEAVPGQVLKDADDRHLFSSFAVECLTRKARKDPEDQNVTQAKRDEFKKKLKDKFPLKPLDEARQVAWNTYLV
ncbi:hypothetical protein GGX14DRAFT_391164 [Mycena pura]|uniref:Uncharacterized protein n=1 Tax=Mycena pura TaxID=153505 RepID=A0AAD6VL44_9AGAR|nr:hypothetical protein GGX14DRAFT_391164 [Mycena pura]